MATQAFGNPRHGSVGLTLPRCGASPQQAVEILLTGDRDSHKRQFALLDHNGAAAPYTGADLDGWEGWAGSTVGRDCVALGNGLAGREVTEKMVGAFQESTAVLAERLMAALEAGQGAGGDIRGQQSAALLVFRRDGGYGALDDRHVVISIYDHPPARPARQPGLGTILGARVCKAEQTEQRASHHQQDVPRPARPWGTEGNRGGWATVAISELLKGTG